MRGNRAVLIVVLVALATVVSAVSSLNLAIPSLGRDTGASQTEIAWIIDAYSLTFAALLLPGGALGDRWGRRRTLLAGLALFAVASAFAMMIDDPTLLIGVRAVLGVAAALVMPATLSTITGTFGPEDRVKGVATWAGVAGASAVLGLFVSGILLEFWSWPSIFALSVVLATVSFIGAFLVVPESGDPEHAASDPLGVVLSLAGLALLVYSVIEAPDAGWGSARTLGGLGAGLLLLVAFVFWELRQERPLLDPRYFRNRPFSAGTLSITVQFLAFFGFIFVFLQYLQLVRGESALGAAVALLPMPAGLMPAARLAPRLVRRFGTAKLCGTGLVMVAASLWWLSRVDQGTDYWILAIGLFVVGAGMGLAMTPATTAITDALPDAEQGVASATNDLSRELGGALGIAILGSVSTSTYGDQLDLATVEIPEAARDSLAAATTMGEPIAGLARDAFVLGMEDALLMAAAIVVAAAVAVVGLLSGRKGAGERAPAVASEE